jgi:UDP-N-acetylmuramyl pentapeptide phosphotransferase/UDP-N-acetylglucosamine-1-phosphate transferase
VATGFAYAALAGMPHDQPLFWVAVVTGCAALSALFIVLIKPLLVRYLTATPNARSSHSVPTPQGAGVAVMLSLLIGCSIVLVWWHPVVGPSLLSVLIGAAGLTILGALDDVHALPVSWRFAGQVLAAVVMVLGQPDELRLLPNLLPLILERTLIVLGTVWLVNAVNFLDGLDWMTVAQVVPMTLGIFALQSLDLVPDSVGLLAMALLGATLGFAWFNKHPAQVFLGDAGSLPIGLCLAFLLICVAEAHIVSALLLALYTLTEATITLFRRIAARERIWSAHRSHFYQRAAIQGVAVPRVTARVLLLSLSLAALAVGAALARSLAADLVLLGVGALLTGLVLRSFARGAR